MIATGHQINLFPGCSVVEKVRVADVFIACDEFQYERHGWVNRNRLADGTWLVAPVDDRDTFVPISRVRLAESPSRWREKLARTLEYRLGAAGGRYAAEVRRPWRLLIGLNAALLRLLLDDLGIGVPWVFQSHLASGRSDGPAAELSVSERLAEMTAEVGADVWLSGPSGRGYLDEQPFHARGIEVRYFDFAGENPSALELLRRAKVAA